MARRKRQFIEDDMDSSASENAEIDEDHFSDDPDAAAERARFADPYEKKKRRRTGKEGAIYGVFGDDTDEEQADPNHGRRINKKPTFIHATARDDSSSEDESESSDDDDEDKDKEHEDYNIEEENEQIDDGNNEEQDREEEISHSGLGTGSRVGLGSVSRNGLGINSASSADTSTKATPTQPDIPTEMPSDMPSSFGQATNKQRRSFLPTSTNSSANRPKPNANLDSSERKHFAKLSNQGGIGFKLLQKMGWQTGTGLGSSNQGIVTPLQGKKLPTGAGISFGKDLEAEERAQKKKEGKKKENNIAPEKRTEPWKRKEKVKPKIQHRTYDEIVGEDGGPAEVGLITDISGQALSSLSHIPVPSSTTTQLPELRHNASLILEQTKSDINHLKNEATKLNEKARWLDGQELKVRRQLNEEEFRMNRLRDIKKISDNIIDIARAPDFRSGKASIQELDEKFTDMFEDLIGLYPEEFDLYNLDELVVATIAPTLQRVWNDWDPLENPVAFVSELKRWKKLFRLVSVVTSESDAMQVDIFNQPNGEQKPEKQHRSEHMSAYESLIWKFWIPRVRSAINNHWNPSEPDAIVDLYSNWISVIPLFVQENILDQLVLPKVRKAIDSWQPPRKNKASSTNLYSVVVPWLEHAGMERMEDILVEAKRKIRYWLRGWKVQADGVPPGLDVWRKVLSKDDWDNLIFVHIVPQLSAILRDKFEVNPKNQDMKPLECVLGWKDLIGGSTLSMLMEEFVRKWVDALFEWLTYDDHYPGQIIKWYEWWKEVFSHYGIEYLRSIEYGQKQILNLMNEGARLGEDSKFRLIKPELQFPSRRTKVPENKAVESSATNTASLQSNEITFRAVVEEIVAENDLLMQPTGKTHDKLSLQLFRVSKNIDGKSGLSIYFRDDIIWVVNQTGEDDRPVSVEEMVQEVKNRTR